MRRGSEDTWIIADGFQQRWRFWIVPLRERTLNDRISRWEIPEDALFHIIYYAFNDERARRDDPAYDLLAMYDVLARTRLHEVLPRPTKDPKRKLRGFKRELSRMLYAALEAGVLKFERVELPWPFPETAKLPSVRPPPGPMETFIAFRLKDQNGNPVPRARYRVTLPDGDVREGKLTIDGRARISGVSRDGACVIEFVDFDQVDHGSTPLKPGKRAPDQQGPVGGDDDDDADKSDDDADKDASGDADDDANASEDDSASEGQSDRVSGEQS
ncbi:MAG TPA: hypothetical protein VNO21_25660 [Polyangiaceae bacterium]|nr:hypothetical protein [Polyangiaceae bacterium]